MAALGEVWAWGVFGRASGAGPWAILAGVLTSGIAVGAERRAVLVVGEGLNEPFARGLRSFRRHVTSRR